MNLTKTSAIARKAIVLVGFIAVLYTIGYLSFPFAVQTFYSVFPKKQEALPVFGRLPAIKFNGIPLAPSAKPEYNLNTRDGRLPNITPQVINVFEIKKPAVSFSAGKNAQKNAATLFFTDENLASELSGSTFRWLDSKFSRELTINITLNTLDYRTNEANIRDLFEATPQLTFDPENTKSRLIDIFESLGYFNDDFYKNGTQKTTYGRITDNGVVETVTPQEYMLAKVDFFRTIQKIPLLGPRFDNGLLEIVYAKPKDGANEALNYTRIKAAEWSVDTEKIGKYPPVPVEVAWKAVQENKGVYAKAKLKDASVFEKDQPLDISRVFIENIYLAYYDSETYQKYLQPIYVFEGTFTTIDGQSGRVVIYTPAIGGNFVATQ